MTEDRLDLRELNTAYEAELDALRYGIATLAGPRIFTCPNCSGTTGCHWCRGDRYVDERTWERYWDAHPEPKVTMPRRLPYLWISLACFAAVVLLLAWWPAVGWK